MRRLALIALILTPFAAHAADIVTNQPVRGAAPSFPGRNCVLKVSFTSTASGIDTQLADGLTARLRKSAVIDRVTIQPWGREGELTYCLETRRGIRAALHVVQTYFRRAGAPRRGTVRMERIGS